MKSSRKPQCLILIQDGVGDLPIESLGGQTPLEAAHTPCMDQLIERGIGGLMHILDPGVPVGTDVGHLALFGQDPTGEGYRRGPMEAHGIGLDLLPGEIALRFNFATLDAEGRLVDRRAGRISQTSELIDCLNQTIQAGDDARARFHAATGHRGVLTIRGEGLSHRISDTDPGDDGGSSILEAVPLDSGDAAARSARALNRIVRQARQALADHPLNRLRISRGSAPANCIVTRGAGVARRYRNLPAQLNLKVACISAEATVLGIARLSGVDTFFRAGMTAALDTDLECKAELTFSALQEYDLVYLHLKGCDIAGHDRQPERKKWFIEQTDITLRGLLERIGPREDFYVALAGDHATPADLGRHSGDPVPVLLAGDRIVPDEVSRYGEKYCTRGRLGYLSCGEFLSVVFDCLRPPLSALPPRQVESAQLGVAR